MVCTFKLLVLGKERVLKFNCSGCERGASIERSEACMREVVRAIIENSDVSAIVLADVYEREYSGSSLEALKEVADFLKSCKHWPFAHLTPNDCDRCGQERRKKLDQILDLLPGDPARALSELRIVFGETRARAERGAKRCRECHAAFIDRSIKPMLSSLERTKLVKDSRGREGYAKVLRPLIRPCFLTSRLAIEPPSGGVLVDAYKLDGSEVKIYRLPEQLQHLYFVVPPEYSLPREQVSLLNLARQLLLERTPSLDPEPLRARGQLERLGEELMAELVVNDKLEVSEEEVKRLAIHLARFTAGFGLIENLLTDARVQDIYIDAPVGRTPVHIYHRDYEECITNIYLTPDDAEALVSRFRAISGRPFSEADPVLDLNINDIRVAAIGHPLSPAGIALALRRHKSTPWTLPQFVRAKFLTPHAAGLLSLLVDSQASLLVAGSRGAGKTSLLSALLLELLPKFRIISIEDTLELPIERLRELGFKVQALRVQSAVSSAGAELRAEDALRAALRLGESVLIVGEVRGNEARTLYEAMRVGAAGNSVMGTIHGATTRDVFERVVHDLNISPSSFKATDAIVVASPIRPRGSVARVRRVVQVAEVRKGWSDDPAKEGGFLDLMSYDAASDELKPTRALIALKSELLRGISRKWGMEPEEVFQNLELRAKFQGALVEAAGELGKPELLEAEFVVRSNLAWHALLEGQLERGRIDYGEIFERWREWLHGVTIEISQGCEIEKT